MPLLRPATSSDEPFLLALTSRLAAFDLPPWRTAEEIALADHGIVRHALSHPSPETSIVIAEDPPGTPVGYVFATTQNNYFTGKPQAHIEILAVAPVAERRGIGRALLDAIEGWAVGRGYGEITLNVFADNERARVVYDRLGYRAEMLRYRKALDTTSVAAEPLRQGDQPS